MKRSFLVRSVLAGLAGILIMAVLVAFCGFMAGQEMEEYYKVPRGYDNDFVGFEWIFLFVLGAMGTFVLIGALAAWAVRGEAPSVKDALKASVIAGLVPIILAIVGGMSLALAMSVSNSNMVYAAIGAVFGLVVMSPMIVGTIFASIILSLIGGLVYAMLLRPLKGGRMTLPAWKRPLLAGAIGGAVILAFHIADVVLKHGVYSFTLGQAGVLVFFVASILSGALAVSGLKRSGIGLAGALQSSLIAGFLTGLARAIGTELGAFARNYNQAGILFSDGIPSLINGMILAAIGGLLYVAFTGKAPVPAAGEATGRSMYGRAVIIGVLAGLALAAITLIPAAAYFVSSLSGSGNTFVYVSLATAMGMTGFLATVTILVAEGILVVHLAPVKSLNDSMAVAAIAGAFTGILSAASDIVNQVATTIIFTSDSAYLPSNGDVIMANIMGSMGCAPLKVVVMTTVCVMAAIIYSAWMRGLKYRETG